MNVATRRHGIDLGVVLLGIRLVQGWIFLGGGTRRFFYAPDKLDPSSAAYMAHKLNHAMPGAAFSMDKVMSYMLTHFSLLHFAILGFTTVELLTGLALVMGLFTRAFAFVSIILAISLMLMFGWLGSTCLDEWSMSACNFAMGAGILISGGGLYSLDYVIADNFPRTQNSRIYRLFAGIDISTKTLRILGLSLGLLSFFYAAFFYHYYHGGIISSLRHRTNMVVHHVQMSDVQISPKTLSFNAYVNAGPDTQGAFVIGVSVRNADDKIVFNWNGKQLTQLPSSAFDNKFKFARFGSSKYGFMAETGAIARITLSLPTNLKLTPGTYYLILKRIHGVDWVTTFTVT